MNLPPERSDPDILLDRALQTGGETDTFDFKEHLDFQGNGEHKIKLLRAIGAFNNTENGGHLIIGISNDRRVVGITAELAKTYDQTPVQRLASEHFSPPPVVQVRHHERAGKRLVLIEVQPFREFPSVVKRYVEHGNERLRDGTFLVRNGAAESALLTSEADVRRLCEAIASRRARAVVELIQRGLIGLPLMPTGTPVQASYAVLEETRARAEAYWPASADSPPYIETFFATERPLTLRVAELKAVFPAAAIPIAHGFPFHDVHGGPVHTATPWGWLGTIPFPVEPVAEKRPGYLWVLHRDGGFVYREHLWEDGKRELEGTVGILHVIGKIVLVLRFLDRVARRLELPDATKFRVGIIARNVKGRCLVEEREGWFDLRLGAMEDRIDSALEVQLGALRGAREDVALNMLEEVAWQAGRQDRSRQDLLAALRSAANHLGHEYAFPDAEVFR